MTTNSEVIRDALGLLGVLAETEALSAEQADHGLRILNDMMADWEIDGIETEYYPQDDINAEFPADDIACVKYNLAVDLAPHYSARIAEAVAVKASVYYQRKVRDSVRDANREIDVTHMPMGTGHWVWKDITG